MLGKLPVPGRPTIWITVEQVPIALAVGAGWGCLVIFTLIYPLFPLSPPLWKTARYRLKYCLKGPLYPKQRTNQPNPSLSIFAHARRTTTHNTQRTHIHRTEIVTTMSRSPQAGSTKMTIKFNPFYIIHVRPKGTFLLFQVILI